MLSSNPTIMTSNLPVSLALSNSASSLWDQPPAANNQNDSFSQPAKSKSPIEQKKGKVPSLLAWGIEFVVPTAVIMSFHRLSVLRQLTHKTRILLSCTVAGASTGLVDYWRQKNNDGKVSWANWAINTALASTPFELLLGKSATTAHVAPIHFNSAR